MNQPNAASTPPATVNIEDMWRPTFDTLYAVATAPAPVTVTGADARRRPSLDSLVRRGLAEVVDHKGQRAYVVTAPGAALANVLWPETRPAPRRRSPRKPKAADGGAS